MDHDIISAKELADYLGINVETVHRMASSGRIPPAAIIRPPGSRYWRFKRSEIEKWAQYDPPRPGGNA